jgi:hypothetical protein
MAIALDFPERLAQNSNSRCAIKAMTTAQSHLHNRSYFGEFTAVPVVDWLNSSARPAGDPVEKLINLNARFPLEVPAREIEGYLAKLVRKSKFAVAPVLMEVQPHRWKMEWRLVGRMDPSQGLAVVKLLHLADEGLLDRVRKCARAGCGVWFFAKFSHQRFDRLTCQQQTFREDPDYKRKRADDVKRARHEAKLRERRGLQLSKRGAKKS